MRRNAAGQPVAGAGRPARSRALDRAVRRLARPAVLAVPAIRWPTLELPGVEVSWSAQPLLWSLVDAVAADLDQPAPDQLRVALAGDAAALDPRTGPRPHPSVLVLPLSHLAALTDVELRSTVAHTLCRPAAAGGVLSVWLRPGSSRRRAAEAAARAARRYGSPPAAPARRGTRALAAAFDAYWTQDVRPLLRAGLRPPLAPGFALYLAAPAVRAELAWEAPPQDAAPASGLLLDLDGLELSLLRARTGRTGPELCPVDWREGPARALPAVWADRARWLADRDLRACELADQLQATVERQPGDQIAADDALMLFGSALSRALARDGWSVGKPPGAPCTLTKGGVVVVPGEELAAVARGEVSPGAWGERCRRLGIADLALGEGFAGAPYRPSRI